MTDISKNTFQDKFITSFQCDCGREHRFDVEDIIIAKDAISTLPAIIYRHNANKIFVMADSNTYDVAGEAVELNIIRSGAEYNKLQVKASICYNSNSSFNGWVRFYCITLDNRQSQNDI